MVDPKTEDEQLDEEKDKIENFMDDPKYETEILEEYDGLNDNFAYFVLIANLEMLMRGHSIKIITQERRINIDVPNLYSLTVNLPLPFDKDDAKAYFD